MHSIFLCYRHDDSVHIVDRLDDHLKIDFGNNNIFKDRNGLIGGLDFRVKIERAVSSCLVVIALIGPNWLDCVDDQGKRRLDDADDFVRIELTAALERGIPVIPVLVDGARQLDVADLPTEIKGLAFRQSIPLRADPDFHDDYIRLVKALRELNVPPKPRHGVLLLSLVFFSGHLPVLFSSSMFCL